ncbi:unnamed protein product [Sphagnum troendelagicum]|uniref:Uncharacterized protein n=1 Tax=Sphagnum troendelagicum TaxID=128251 RepID=A0ABP0U5T7_9BRYO
MNPYCCSSSSSLGRRTMFGSLIIRFAGFHMCTQNVHPQQCLHLTFPEASLPGEEFEGTGKQLPDVEEEESVLEYLKRQLIGIPFLNEVELPKSLAVLQQLLLLGRKEKQENPWVH